MAFDSFQAFLSMGGYGFFVWLSFAVFIVSIILMIVITVWQTKRIHQDIKLSILREQRLRAHRQRQPQEAKA